VPPPSQTGLEARPTRIVAGEQPLTVRVSLRTADGKPIPDSHPVHIDVLGPTGDRMPLLCRRVTLPADATVSIPTRLGDPAGEWTLRVTDCLTSETATQKLTVAANPSAAGLPPVDDIFYPSAHLGKIAVSAPEFLSLLGALDTLYRTGGEKDKGTLSYYCLDRDLSRHRLMKLLNEADWVALAPALRRYVEAGHEVILTGEDLGRDALSGLSTDPVNGPGQDDGTDMAMGGRLPALPAARQLEALSQVTGRDLRAPWPGGRLVITLGQGRIILDQTSLDDQGMGNGEFALDHARWLKTLP
jgi:hypothetical protein